MKKILLWTLGVLMAMPVMARDFLYQWNGQTLAYTVVDENAKTVEVASWGNRDVAGYVEIPESVSNSGKSYRVVAIGDRAFSENRDLKSVKIPDGVTSIGECAFYFCTNLTSVTLPEGLTSIDQSAFMECARLSEITLPESLKSIGRGAFGNCSRLRSITIPRDITWIGGEAFYHCFDLHSVYYLADKLFSADRNIGDTFDEFTYKKCTLYLTKEGKKMRKKTEPWKHFKKVKVIEPSSAN